MFQDFQRFDRMPHNYISVKEYLYRYDRRVLRQGPKCKIEDLNTTVDPAYWHRSPDTFGITVPNNGKDPWK